jgi:hypothetical protein
MRKILLIAFIIINTFKIAIAQDFDYGLISNEDLDMKTYSKDTSAHAVVLREFGKSRIAIDNSDDIKLYFDYHVKIKILDEKGFDNGTVQIPVYNNRDNDSYESVDGIKGVTFYKDDAGNMQQVELEQKKIYPEKVSKHWGNYKFAMPGLKKGCIIEYRYTIASPYFENLHRWEFQSDIPKMYSEYEVHIPAFWVYNASLKGALKLAKSSGVVESKCFESHGASCDCSVLVNAMKDIPAFIEEEHMTSPKNFESAINFEEVEFTNPYNGVKTKITKEWKDIDYQLKSEPDFGGQLKRKGLFKDKIIPVIAGKATDVEKAKAVYAYIQKLFKWNEFRGIYSVDGIGKAIDTRSGSVADINLALIAALNAAGLNASAVLLSTRDNGAINTLYPVVGDFDYVVARVDIGDQNYLLDATDPLLPFGMLPFKCLNDKGRVFSLDKPSYWVDLNLPQKEKTTRAYDFTLQDDGKIKGTVINYYGGYEAYSKRKAIKKFNSTDEYVEDLASKLPKFKILKSEILNVDSLELPLSEKFDVEISLYDKSVGDKLAFNPFFMDKISTNPFKLAERSYPVDWGMASEDRFVLTMHLPAQYEIEKPPQIISVSLPNAGGQFLSSYEPSGNTFTFSNIIKFNKSVYGPEEYPYLKEIYNKIIQAEKAEMVFKKK